MTTLVTVAVDGPAGSGKSTVAKLLAKELGFLYIDSGAMYRAVTYKWLELGSNDALLEKIMSEVDIRLEDNSKQVLLNGKDISKEIRTNNVSTHVSHVASFQLVREKLVELQRKIAAQRSVVMDGRDIGTVVFPNADFKFFMLADPEVRAKRRLKELKSKGEKIDLKVLVEQIKERDRMDSQREISPLVKAADAIEIDTSKLNIQEVLGVLLENVKTRA